MPRESLPRFRIVIETGHDGGRILRASGPLDRHTVDRLVAAIDELPSASLAGLTVDLAAVSFCDSPALLRLEQYVASVRRQGGAVTVQHPSTSVVRIMDAEDAVGDHPA